MSAAKYWLIWLAAIGYNVAVAIHFHPPAVWINWTIAGLASLWLVVDVVATIFYSRRD